MYGRRRRLVSTVLWIGVGAFAAIAIASWNRACARNLPLAPVAFGLGVLTIAATLASARADRPAARASIVIGIAAGIGLFFLFFFRWVDSCTA